MSCGKCHDSECHAGNTFLFCYLCIPNGKTIHLAWEWQKPEFDNRGQVIHCLLFCGEGSGVKLFRWGRPKKSAPGNSDPNWDVNWFKILEPDGSAARIVAENCNFGFQNTFTGRYLKNLSISGNLCQVNYGTIRDASTSTFCSHFQNRMMHNVCLLRGELFACSLQNNTGE